MLGVAVIILLLIVVNDEATQVVSGSIGVASVPSVSIVS